MPKSKKRAPKRGRAKAGSASRRIPGSPPAVVDERSMGLAVAESVLAVAPRQRAETSSASNQLRMSIAAGLGGDGSSLALHRETELVRAGLLYADHVTLLSPRARLISAASALDTASTSVLFRAYSEFARRIPQDPQVMALLPVVGPFLQAIENPSLRRLLPPEIEADLHGMLAGLEDAKASMQDALSEIEASAGSGELRLAEQAGLLFIDPLVPQQGDKQYLRTLRRHLRDQSWCNGRGANGLVEVLSARVGRLLQEGRSLPLLDDEIGDLARRGLSEGVFREGAGVRGRVPHAGMAAGLLDRLPSFPMATMDEIFEIRQELSDPLIRFRREVVDMSRELQDHALDDDFAAYIDSAWTARVEPALLEIREAIQDNRYLRQLTGELMSGTPLAAGATAGLAMALGEGTATGVITATASWLIAGAASSAKSARDGAKGVSRGAFWFLHETERRLRAAG